MTPEQIGERLRAARQRQELTLSALAERVELTKGFLSQVERGLTSPSVGSLLRLCEVLDLPVGELFDANPAPLVRAAERSPISFGGAGVDEFQLTPAGERRLVVIQSDIAPGGGSGEDAYRLGSDAEFVHVLLGTLDLEVAGDAYRLAAGDSLTFDAGAEHRWRNPSPSWPARVLWVIAPALG
ncbi:helix-turn-helix domain-containing protein [Conexibacter woesei]|uniref:Transcriptional regulator, XRE family n=1 Tax=Conexibacter woesei (strain DSM 14684 / CCUG 47730 / CIP 108061 / JCM 11494 / NBRC 100937 / ID131577) TaxID=469383 RepID=D3F8N4_CONWI|nr:XRE family transcriptional regulator [Conexibacter woesei]ADB50998.1 transcriptional regulator, XRE family [Conexibacter woesei DSM 14684]